jgi:hypothetical protein
MGDKITVPAHILQDEAARRAHHRALTACTTILRIAAGFLDERPACENAAGRRLVWGCVVPRSAANTLVTLDRLSRRPMAR